MKSRSEYIEAALEAYSQFANKKATEYVEKNVLPIIFSGLLQNMTQFLMECYT